jgi:hypothetical protein
MNFVFLLFDQGLQLLQQQTEELALGPGGEGHAEDEAEAMGLGTVRHINAAAAATGDHAFDAERLQHPVHRGLGDGILLAQLCDRREGLARRQALDERAQLLGQPGAFRQRGTGDRHVVHSYVRTRW